MSLGEIFVAQLLDPFRIGLLAALLLTTRNTVAATGVLIPLAAGLLFVAVLIPTTFAPQDGDAWWTHVFVGIASNGVILAIMIALWLAWRRVIGSDNSQSR